MLWHSMGYGVDPVRKTWPHEETGKRLGKMLAIRCQSTFAVGSHYQEFQTAAPLENG
jgi:hypothetical protein